MLLVLVYEDVLRNMKTKKNLEKKNQGVTQK